MEPVLSALRSLGGSARPAEVVEKVAEILGIGDAERSEPMSSGTARFDNMVAWARFYLAKAGMVDASRRGVWALTDKGRAAKPMSHAQAIEMYKDVHQKFSVQARLPAGGQSESGRDEDDEEAPEPATAAAGLSHREEVLSLLMSLPPAGFERFCQRLLRESDFQEVTVTGRSGDEGIDGIGILQVNPLVSFKVLFQCKRYKKVVSAGHVRDFRGAMEGRADKGIIITTGTFSADARREAVRDGAKGIELVDGQKLVSMLEELELGLTPVRAFRVERDFFADFGDNARS
jgi:restriction system protein